MNSEDVADMGQIEISIANAKKLIEFGEALQRLESNLDYKKVIEGDFLKDNIVRLVRLKATPACQDEVNQKFIMQQIEAAGQFEQYLMSIRVQGQSANRTRKSSPIS